MKPKKTKRSGECEEYIKLIDKYVDRKQREGVRMENILCDEERPFLKLLNNCGPFKSAYA